MVNLRMAQALNLVCVDDSLNDTLKRLTGEGRVLNLVRVRCDEVKWLAERRAASGEPE